MYLHINISKRVKKDVIWNAYTSRFDGKKLLINRFWNFETLWLRRWSFSSPFFFLFFFPFLLTKNSTHTHVHARITHTSTHRASSNVYKCTSGVAQPVLGTEWNKRRVVLQLPAGKHICINNYCKRKYKKTKGNYIFLFLSTTLKRFPIPFDISL